MKKKNSPTPPKRSGETVLGENRIIPEMKNPIPMPKGAKPPKKPPKNSQGSPASPNKANSKG